jgi:adenylate kinase
VAGTRTVAPPGIWRALLLLGPTGSGKTPLGRLLEEKGLGGTRCFHFDFGANLRRIAGSGEEAKRFADDELGTVRRSLETGALFEDENFPLAVKILGGFIAARGVTPEDLLVLNGFPRHEGQARGLTGIVDVRRVVLLEAGAEVIGARIREDTGGDRVGRADDALAEVRSRLRIFEERTLPLVGFYRGRGIPVTRIEVDARMSAGAMLAALSFS